MTDINKTNNIIQINQQANLEQQLKGDAQKLNAEIPTHLREDLLAKIAQQQMINDATTSNHSFFKNKFAIAASIVFSVFVIQYSMNNQPGNNQSFKQPELAEHSEKSTTNNLFSSFSAELVKKDKLASQELNNEYKAILADMEKVKQRIIRL